jgi:acyl dehydratase
MACAAATGDMNACYFDETRDGGIIAPPLFVLRLEWPLRPNFAGLTLAERLRGVHATHDVTFQQPMRPGDTLQTSGRVIAVEERKPGAYVVTRYRTIDSEGRPVATTDEGSLLLGTHPTTAATGSVDEPARPPAPPDAGPRWEIELAAPRALPYVYAECTEIINPIHTEISVALAAGFPDIILQGRATLALASTAIVDREAGGDPRLLRRIGCRFSGYAIPGEALHLRCQTDPGREPGVVAFTVTAPNGRPVVTHGFALIGSGNA